MKKMGKNVIGKSVLSGQPKHKNTPPLTINEEKVLKRITANPGKQTETYYKGGWEKRALLKLEEYGFIAIKDNKAKPSLAQSEGAKILQEKGVIKVSAKKVEASKKTTTKKSDSSSTGKKKKLHPGYKAVLNLNMEGVNINTNVRYLTVPTERLVNTEYRAPDGTKLKRKYVGGGKRREAFLDNDGNETPKVDVQIVQILADGTTKPIEKFKRTSEFKPIRYVDKEKMEDFLPESYVSLWGETPEAIASLKDIAFKMVQSGKVPVFKYTSGGTKVSYGFMYPRMEGDQFTIEMMISGTKKNKARWMPVETSEIKSKVEAELPDIF